MNKDFVNQIARETGLNEGRISAVLALLEDGATLPFIARYRKEASGSMDEVDIARVRDRSNQLTELKARKDFILKTIEDQGNLNTELADKIHRCGDLAELEDLYLPFKPKRKTRASMAKEKGLEPLAKQIMAQNQLNVSELAAKYVSKEKSVADKEEALKGARDIIAEWVSESAGARKSIRKLYQRTANIRTRMVKGKESAGEKFKDYFDWQEPLSKAPSHRLLAMMRALNEGVVSLKIEAEDGEALFILDERFVKNHTDSAEEVQKAVKDGWKRLLAPAMETEMKSLAKERADEEAIRVFASNLRELMMAPALGQKRVLALDPGFRTGCKVVCLDRQGKLLHNETIYPHSGAEQTEKARIKLEELIRQFDTEAIAIGNGTAGRETETFIKTIDLPSKIEIVMVNESGASIYSASALAREEFPDKDITVRGAVSIGRRLMDPLAELVKLDPKSIGVGQYQHDVDQGKLKHSLSETVESCVNRVGVEVNTASKQLLAHVSGLGPQLAGNIIQYRNKNGPFKARSEFKKVPRLGEKAFEQCAGFLRIREGNNPLDASAVHPESYSIVKQMAKDLNCDISDLMADDIARKNIDLKKYVSGEIGLPTLNDILQELAKPGRDPREKFEAFSFAEGINAISDLKNGMVLPGIVTNVTKFGAFVDIGVHQDGLVHISQIADQFVKDPADIVKVQQKVKVQVTDVDENRGRISLSMKGLKN